MLKLTVGGSTVFEHNHITWQDTLANTIDTQYAISRTGTVRLTVRNNQLDEGTMLELLVVLEYVPMSKITTLRNLARCTVLRDGTPLITNALIINPLSVIEQRPGYYTTSLIFRGKAINAKPD